MSKKNITNAEAIAQNTANFVGDENLTSWTRPRAF